MSGPGLKLTGGLGTSPTGLGIIQVQDEGIALAAEPAINFVGAGVVAADDAANNRTNVTIVGAVASGWTDTGTRVELVTAADTVAIGASAMVGAEKVRITHTGSICLELDGAVTGPEINTWLNAVVPANNDTVGVLRSYGNSSTGVKREYARLDLISTAVANTLEFGRFEFSAIAGGTASRLLQIIPSTAGLVESGVILRTLLGAGTGAYGFSLRVSSDYGATDVVVSMEDNDGVRLWQCYGAGDTEQRSTSAGATGPTHSIYHDSGTPAVNDVIAEIEANGNDNAAGKTVYGDIQWVILAVGAGVEEGSFVIRPTTAGAPTAACTFENARMYAEAGTQALPGISWRTDHDTGLWEVSGDRFAVICGTAAILDFDYNGGTPTVGVCFDGTVAVAAVSRDTDRDTGIYWVTTDEMAITAGGSQIATFAEVAGVARIGFLGAGSQIRQTSGADLTNNVTVGGTNNQIDNVVAAPVDVNAASLVSTRDAIYQLARKLKQVNDALRLYGLLT